LITLQNTFLKWLLQNEIPYLLFLYLTGFILAVYGGLPGYQKNKIEKMARRVGKNNE